MTRALSLVSTVALALTTTYAAPASAQEDRLPHCSDDHVIDAVVHVLTKHTAVQAKAPDDSIGNVTEVSATQVSRTCSATIKATVSRKGVVKFGDSDETTIQFTIAPSEQHGRFSGYVVSVNLVD